jgi:hypothetical protein
MRFGLLTQFLPGLDDLGARDVECTGVVDDEIGGFDLLFVGKLCGHAARYFFSGCFQIDLLPCGKALDPLLWFAGHDDDAVEVVFRACFENQRSFHNRHCMWIPSADFFHPLVLPAHHRGMHNAIEFLHARGRLAPARICRAKRNLGQTGAVHAEVGIQNLPSKMPHHFLVDRFTWTHELVSDAVRLDQMRTQRDEHLPDNRFSRGNAAGQSDFEHRLISDSRLAIADCTR